MEPTCTIHEFASRNEVTVRALHHYDRLGLLCPCRSASGYRRYAAADTCRLRQILALRWVGLSLREIGRLLADESADIADALHRRRAHLEEMQQKLNSAIAAIRQAGLIASGGTAADPRQREQIIKVIGLNWAMTGVKPSAGEFALKLQEWKGRLGAEHSAGEMEQMRKESAGLLRDAAAASNRDPSGPEGQSIAARYRRLLAQQCRGNPKLLASVLELHHRIPVFPDGMGLPASLENFSNHAWVFPGKALDASRR